jgi:hypothetical protein
MEENWTKVGNKKKEKRDRKKEKKEEWKKLEQQYPHLMTPEKIELFLHTRNISNFERKFLTQEWIDYQTNSGWIFFKVITEKENNLEDDETFSYSSLNLNNKWGDKVLFKKYRNI